jgi:cytidylate kinase
MAVITISRQFGCGGEYVAERVADLLEFKLFNKELVKYAAVLTGSDEKKIKIFDEEEHSTFRSFMSKYFDMNMFSDLFSETDYSAKTLRQIMADQQDSIFDSYGKQDSIDDAEAFQEMLRRIINKVAEHTDAVIVGRGGVCILQNNPQAVHVRFVAEMEDRIEWVSSREKLSRKQAMERIKDVDSRKRSYFKHYFDKDIDDHWLYHCVFNLSKLDIQEASMAIVGLAKLKLKL